MSGVNSVENVLPDYSVENRIKPEVKTNDMGQDTFLRLMITQMQHQDPLNPQDQGDFVAQLAQFSSVESLDKMNNKFDAFAQNFIAGQALDASSLVGRSATVPAKSTLLEPGGVVTTLVDVPASTGSVRFEIHDKSGALVDEFDAGAAKEGQMVVRWDGLMAEINGEPLDWRSRNPQGLPPGKYTINAFSSVDGKTTQLTNYLSANINSVTIGAKGGLVLNLAGVGAVNMADVKQFSE
jgi:flagellar basal-body rod modification protein FlgD